MSTTRELFETNTFGVMAMTQAVVPQMRARRSGVIVNVTSSVTLAAMPLAAVYTGSKMAIEGFTGSLALELAHFDVAVKLVEPGYGPSTQFTANGSERMGGTIPAEYQSFAEPIMAAFGEPRSRHDRRRRRGGGVSGGHRYVGPAQVSRRCRRGGIGVRALDPRWVPGAAPWSGLR